MAKFKVESIENGWLITGPRFKDEDEEVTLFLSSINDVDDILKTWQILGFVKAIVKIRKYEVK